MDPKTPSETDRAHKSQRPSRLMTGLLILLATACATRVMEIRPPLPKGEIARLDKVGERKAARFAKQRYDKPHEAQDFYLFKRTGGAPLDQALINKARAAKLAMPLAVGDVTSWTPVGPGNIGGRTRALLVHPNFAVNNTMYAAGVAGGVWKTTNGGTSWAPLDDLMANLAVVSLCFEGQGGAFVNTSVIYAGTGEGFFNSDAVRGAGIFKSLDGGTTWAQLPATNNSNFRYVNKVVASPNNPAVIYAATQTGVWKSADSGASWGIVLADTGLNNANNTVSFTGIGILDLAIRTDVSPDVLIASNGSFSTDGIYRSLDAGGSWTRVQVLGGRASLAIAPSNQQTMYALCSDAFNGHRLLNVYRSLDGGATWTARVSGTFTGSQAKWLLLTNPLFANYATCAGGANQFYNQGWYDNIIAVAPHNENVLFAGGVDLFRSTDGGANWGIISYWWMDGVDEFAHADQHAIVFHPGWNGAANQTLFVGNDGGVFRSTNAVSGAVASGTAEGACYFAPSVPSTVDWVSLNNSYAVTQFYHGLPHPSPTTTYFGGTQDNGTIKGSDAAGVNGWTELTGGDGGYVAVNPSNTQIVFAEYTNKSIQRATNGVSFSSIVAGVGQITESTSNYLFIAPFRMSPSNPDNLWSGGWYPWRCNNASSAATSAAVTWTRAGLILPGAGSVSAWAIAPNDGNKVWAGMSDGAIARVTTALTATSTTPWTTVSPVIPGSKYISWIECDPTVASGETVYATQSRYNAGNHVYRTTTGGSSGWTNITSNLPDIPVHCIVVHPQRPNILYVGTDLGVFRSTDTGGSWSPVNSPGFANTPVESMHFQNNTTLYAFTHGRSAWRAVIEPPNTAGEDWKDYD